MFRAIRFLKRWLMDDFRSYTCATLKLVNGKKWWNIAKKVGSAQCLLVSTEPSDVLLRGRLRSWLVFSGRPPPHSGLWRWLLHRPSPKSSVEPSPDTERKYVWLNYSFPNSNSVWIRFIPFLLKWFLCDSKIWLNLSPPNRGIHLKYKPLTFPHASGRIYHTL